MRMKPAELSLQVVKNRVAVVGSSPSQKIQEHLQELEQSGAEVCYLCPKNIQNSVSGIISDVDLVLLLINPPASVATDAGLISAVKTFPFMVVCSGPPSDAEVVAYLQAGALDVLDASISDDIFQARIHHCIDQAKRYEELLRETQRLHQLSFQDDLTGLWNRRYLLTRLTEELDRIQRYKGELSLILMDVDYFKEINDTYGHLVGDEALCHIAQQIRENCRSIDIISRYGGDEFLILLPETVGMKARIVAEKIRAAIQHSPLYEKGKTIKLSTSGGIVSYRPGKWNPYTLDELRNHLLQKADEALYASKQFGKNRLTAKFSKKPHRLAKIPVEPGLRKDAREKGLG